MVAFRLSQAGVQVSVFDKAEPARGTTAASFAWINANNKTPREYFELNHAGMQEHLRLRDELPGDTTWFHQSGNLIWAAGEDLDELNRRVERLRNWGYAAEWRTASQVKAELEPYVAFPDLAAPLAFFPQETWVDAPWLTNLLLERAVEAGAVVRPGVGAGDILSYGDRVSGVTATGGEHVPVDAVVNAAGPNADQIAELVGRELPLESQKGLIVQVTAEDGLLGRLFHTPQVNLRPDGPRRLLLNHDSVDENLGDGDEEYFAEELLIRAKEIIPLMTNAGIADVRVGTRPMPMDGFSCVGGEEDLHGYYEAVTHSGVTLGPLIGRLLAQEILTDEIDPLLAPFRPDRYVR
ncbi:FAD-binding oxidoreductase [soil metagenome]